MHPSRWTNLQRFRFHCSKPKLEIFTAGPPGQVRFPFLRFPGFCNFPKSATKGCGVPPPISKVPPKTQEDYGALSPLRLFIRHPPDDGFAQAEMITLEGFWRRQPVDMEVLCGQAGDIGALSAKMRSLLSSRRKSPLAFDGASSGECGLRERARFVGPQFDEDKKKSFERADAFVLPSLSEGFPMVTLRSLVLWWASRFNDVVLQFAHWVKKGCRAGNEFLTPESIWGGIGMLSALSDADRSRMRKLGRALVSETLTRDRVTVKVREMYDWALGGGRYRVRSMLVDSRW